MHADLKKSIYNMYVCMYIYIYVYMCVHILLAYAVFYGSACQTII